MGKAGYSASTEAAVPVTTTAKSVLGVNSPASFGCDLLGFTLSFDSVTAANGACLVEVCYATFATNAPGTASTTVTVDQRYGRAITPGFTAARNWTTEPTVLTVVTDFYLEPYKTLMPHDYSFGTSFDSAVSNGFVIRLTAAAGSVAYNFRGALRFERA
jgi:hypothetical protein